MSDTMPDGRPMHPPCTCPECSDGPGIDFKAGDSIERMARIVGVMELDREQRQRRLAAWRDQCHNGN